MAEVVLFHHVQGLTDGVRALAAALAGAEHIVRTPELFDGRTPATVEDGLALTESIGAEELTARADAALADLPDELVYAGISFGGATAQRYAQQRAGARGALLYESFVSLSADWSFGPWPDGVPVQVHGKEHDPFFAGEGDLDGARELVGSVPQAQLFVYPGDTHLFTDSSLPGYDAGATALVVQRSRELLAGLK